MWSSRREEEEESRRVLEESRRVRLAVTDHLIETKVELAAQALEAEDYNDCGTPSSHYRACHDAPDYE